MSKCKEIWNEVLINMGKRVEDLENPKDMDLFIKKFSAKLFSDNNMMGNNPTKETVENNCKITVRNKTTISNIKKMFKINIVYNNVDNGIISKSVNTENILFKLFWSGYNIFMQYIACHIALKISGKSMGRTVELSNISKLWTESCGNWDEELKNINDLLPKSEKKIHLDKCNNKCMAAAIRKNIWDKVSVKYSKYKDKLNDTYSIIVLPLNLTRVDQGVGNTFLDKTLLKHELPNMKCDRICVIFIDTSNYKDIYILNNNNKIQLVSRYKIQCLFHKFNNK